MPFQRLEAASASRRSARLHLDQRVRLPLVAF
jgi:hypothetical protein